MLEVESGMTQSAKALQKRKMIEQKTKFAEGKFNSDRSAGVLSEPNPLKAVRRVLRDKKRVGISLSNADGHRVRVGFASS